MIQKPFCVRPQTLTGIATGNERANRPASHLGLPQFAGMRWQSTGNANLWVRGQFGGASQAINFVSLMSANAQPGTTIRVRLGTSQAEVDGESAPYDSGALPFILRLASGVIFDGSIFDGGIFADGDTASVSRLDGLYHSHLELPSVVNATWWRIDIGGHTGDFSASALVMGERRTPSNFYNRDREIGFEDMGSLEISRNGIVAETPGVMLRSLLFRLEWASETEWFDLWAPLFAVKGKRQILFICFDPDATVRRQDKTFLGFMVRDLFMRGGIAPTANQIDIQLRAII